jgi:thiol-disulfide isomerase/thioredoxin
MDLDLRSTPEAAPVYLPFLFDLAIDTNGMRMVVLNGEESILVDDIVHRDDSLFIRMPLFDSEFKGRLLNDSTYVGHWYNYLKGTDYRIPFVANAGVRERVTMATEPVADISGNWECHFAGGTPDAYPALGIFRAENGRVTGTFCTETGDYRFLDGAFSGDSLRLSAFDGSHAFLFTAELRNDSLVGLFHSGIHSIEPWWGVRNNAFQLSDPDSLTHLKEGYDMVEFSFPSIDGTEVSTADDRFKGRVMMVQVMGSWCPNCMDETILLDEMYSLYHDKGLDVIALAFERNPDPIRAVEGLRAYRDRLHVHYDILYAGTSSKETASARLPFLDRIMSYPTCIFIDRSGKVRRVRTGFYGPGTGEHYENYKRNLRAFLEELLAEKPAMARKAA